MNDYDIVIAGAGMVGVSTALWAQKRGHRVLLADPNPPGSGTSFGNACTLATYACIPVNDPSVIWSMPQLLFGRDSPLALSLVHALRSPRWMASFLANCTTARSRRIAGHLAQLLGHADAGLNPLIAEAGAEDLVVRNGQLSIWSTDAAARSAASGLALRSKLGIPLEHLSSQDAERLEPNIAFPIKQAVYYPEARHLRDPEALILRMHSRFEALGGHTKVGTVDQVHDQGAGVMARIGSDIITCGHVVIASGAFSRRISGAGTSRLPLGTERGYHLIFAQDGHRISRPVGWGEGGFYAVPMAKGLRIAGTVEIAGLDAPANPNRLAYLERRARQMFGDLPPPDSHWLGYRPTMPDSLPVIGHSPKSKRIIHAFGHQHLGLTLGGITGRIVTDLAEGRQPNIDIRPYRPDRSFVR